MNAMNSMCSQLMLPTIVTTACPLDNLSTSAKNSMTCAFSVKRLLSTYNGPILKIRNSSNSFATDFYADNNGNLGTSLNGTGVSLSSFLSPSAKGYVQTWYNQCNNFTANVVQSVTTSQPSVNASMKYVNFADNTDAFLIQAENVALVSAGTGDYTIVLKNYLTGSVLTNMFFQGAKATGQACFLDIGTTTANINNGWWGASLNQFECINGFGANTTMTFVYSTGDNYRYYYKNGSSSSSNSQSQGSTTRNLSATYGTIGCQRSLSSNTVFWNGSLYFMTAFSTVLSSSDRAIAEQLTGY